MICHENNSILDKSLCVSTELSVFSVGKSDNQIPCFHCGIVNYIRIFILCPCSTVQQQKLYRFFGIKEICVMTKIRIMSTEGKILSVEEIPKKWRINSSKMKNEGLWCLGNGCP